MNTSTQSATRTFKGLEDPNGFEIEYVEFHSPVWAGTGYVAGITVSQSSVHPTDRVRCTSAEIVGENWRFVLGTHGAVLVSNANIKFIWTVAPEVSAAENNEDQKSVSIPEALRHIGQTLHKKGFGQNHTDNRTVSNFDPQEAMAANPPAANPPDPTVDFQVENPPEPAKEAAPAPEATEPPKRKRGRPRKNPLPE